MYKIKQKKVKKKSQQKDEDIIVQEYGSLRLVLIKKVHKKVKQ